MLPAPVAVGGGGGGYGGGAPQPPGYHLPPMSNVRTKNDLINIDQFLEQMQNTIWTWGAGGNQEAGEHHRHNHHRRRQRQQAQAFAGIRGTCPPCPMFGLRTI
jgi:hypothetical protein